MTVSGHNRWRLRLVEGAIQISSSFTVTVSGHNRWRLRLVEGAIQMTSSFTVTGSVTGSQFTMPMFGDMGHVLQLYGDRSVTGSQSLALWAHLGRNTNDKQLYGDRFGDRVTIYNAHVRRHGSCSTTFAVTGSGHNSNLLR